MNYEILESERISKIIEFAEQRYFEEINLDVYQALKVMLKITFFFKFHMDYQIQWYSRHQDRMDKELEKFKIEEGIKNWNDEMSWIHKNGALQYHICIPDLLLQTLYSLNGSYYRINDRDYDWEDEFYKIFIGIPYGREFDLAITKFLLLPLYNSTHNTKYVMAEATQNPS